MNVPQANAGEIYAGAITNPAGITTHIYLLSGEFRGPFKKAGQWAAEQGGDLPNCPESALLFAHLKDEFSEDWYWTNETCAWNDAYAWCQGFNYGDQFSNHLSTTLRARAVRRLVIE